jgi:hypothetical protein
MEVSGQLHTPIAFTSGGKSRRYASDMRQDGPHNLDVEEKSKIFCRCRKSNPDSLVVRPIACGYSFLTLQPFKCRFRDGVLSSKTQAVICRTGRIIYHTTQTSYIGKHATNRNKSTSQKKSHGAVHPQYAKYPYSI